MYTDFEDIDIDGKDANGNSPGRGNHYGGYGEDSIYQPDYSAPPRPHAKYQFYSEEELITSEVFQRCLGQSLAHKDIEIHRLREELLREYWRDRSGN